MDKTSKLGLNLPEKGFRDWDVPINENFSLIDAADAQNVKLTGNQTIEGHKTFTTRLITKNNGAHQVYTTDKNSEYTIDNARAFREDGRTPWFFVGAQKNQNGNYYQRMGIWNNDNTAFAAINVGFKPDGSLFTEVPVPSTSDNSSNIATTNWTRAVCAVLDRNNVFTEDQKLAKSVPVFVLDKTGGTYGEIQTRKAGVRTGGFRNIEDSGYNQTYIYVASEDGTTIKGVLGINFDGTNVYTQAPNPAVSDNSTKIATTYYINNKFQKVAALPDNADPNIWYFIKE